MKKLLVVFCIATILGITGTAFATPFQSGGDRLVETQNNDGGWDWPLDNGNPDTGSAANTIGPIGMGLAQAYKLTNDAGQYEALEKLSSFLQSKTVFSPSDGYLAAVLDDILVSTANVAYVNANFYDKLAAGTYERNGTSYTTESYIEHIREVRTGDYANLAAWDIGMGIVGAESAGADTSAWINGTKAEINELDGDNNLDVLGLAGGLYGLAYAGEDFDPTAGEHAGASGLLDLADILASYQIDFGGFSWNSKYLSAGDEAAQETAYAILALNEVSRSKYGTEIQGAAAYLIGTQLATGGWGDNGENNEVTGEALWGISAAEPVPEPSTIVLFGIGILGLGIWRRKSVC